MEIGRLIAPIMADDKDFQRKMNAADRKGKSVADSLRKTFASLKLSGPEISFGGMLSEAGGGLIQRGISAITGGMTDGVKAGIQYNKTLENATVALESLGMSGAQAQKHLAELESLSLRTPFEFQDVIRATLSMNAFGFSAQTRIQDLTALSDAAAIAAAGNGKFADSFQGIVMALGQMRSKGKVSAEEMNQLAERGIPAWDILAKKVGATKQELMKLGEQGKLRGDVGAALLIEGLGQFAAGTSERLSRTTQGKESNAADALAKRAGEDVLKSGALAAYQDSLDRAIEGLTEKAGQSLTQNLLSRFTDSYQLILDALTGRLSGGEVVDALKKSGADMWGAIADGFTGAISSKGAAAYQSVTDWASGIIKSAKDALGIKSPSTVFAAIADDVAKGFDNGINDKIDRSSEGIKKWAKAIEAAGGEEFLKAVEAMAKRLKADPNKLLNVMAFESRLNPKADNPISTATGLIQFMKATAEGLGTTVEKLKGMSAIDQLKYVEAYFQQFKKMADTQEAVYTAVLAGRPVSDPESVLFREAKGKAGAAYRANKALDKDASGTITAREAAAQTYKQGFLSPAVEKAIIETAVNTRAVADVAVKAPIFAQVGPVAGGSISVDIVGSLAEAVPHAAALDQTLFKLSNSTALAKAAAAPLPPALEAAAKGMDAVTASSSLAALRLDEANKKWGTAAERLESFKERLGQGFDDAIGALIEGGGRWQDVAKNIAVDFFNGLATEFMLAATGGKYGSIGGLLGGLLGGVVSGFFGPKIGGASPSGVPTFAGGGYMAGGLAMVGEDGPELVNFSRPAQVYSASDTQAMMGNKIVNVTINVPITAQGGQVSPKTRQQIATETAAALQFALGRNG